MRERNKGQARGYKTHQIEIKNSYRSLRYNNLLWKMLAGKQILTESWAVPTVDVYKEIITIYCRALGKLPINKC